MPCTIIVVASDRLGSDDSARYYRGYPVIAVEQTRTGNTPTANPTRFVQFEITDKTVEQIDNRYFSEWTKLIDMNVTNSNGLTRRINVRNNNTNTSETIGGWTVQGTNAIIDEWNSRYPECGLFTVEFPSYNTWTCQGDFTQGQAEEFESVIISEGVETADRIRLWKVGEPGMLDIEAAGGVKSMTALQFDNRVVDGRDT